MTLPRHVLTHNHMKAFRGRLHGDNALLPRNRVLNHLRSAQRHQTHLHNAEAHGSPFQHGDEVMFNTPNSPPGRSTKFHRPWSGPYLHYTPSYNSQRQTHHCLLYSLQAVCSPPNDAYSYPLTRSMCWVVGCCRWGSP